MSESVGGETSETFSESRNEQKLLDLGVLKEAFDELFESQYDYTSLPEGEESDEYFEDELQTRPGLVELREHIAEKLSCSDYFNWRGGDEIGTFVEGFTAAAILLQAQIES